MYSSGNSITTNFKSWYKMTVQTSTTLNLGYLCVFNISTCEVAVLSTDHTNAIQRFVEESELYKNVWNRTKIVLPTIIVLKSGITLR